MSERPAPYRTARGGDRSASHSALLAACEEYVRLHGGWTLRIIGGVGQRAGSPDCVGVLAGRALCIEAKTGRARLSVAQEREQIRWIEAGAVYCVVRELDDLEDALLGAGLIDAPSIVRSGRRLPPVDPGDPDWTPEQTPSTPEQWAAWGAVEDEP